ncbi:hypothetical protein TNCV_2347931 [Trichonephila clavipes]|uniref:Uncharacterized protein n=1 Tax=Trichonephila clavipes TaxID=2585209 RepID=A0A8X6VPF5_TRICX|nr:hypothetical protein TNCV_2347931 [Trichonephila clavipes]
MKAVSVLEHFSDHDSIHQKLKKNTASVYSIAQLGSVRALVPQKFSVEEELMHVKHVDVKSPHVGVMWKFGRGVISSGIVLVT